MGYPKAYRERFFVFPPQGTGSELRLAAAVIVAGVIAYALWQNFGPLADFVRAAASKPLRELALPAALFLLPVPALMLAFPRARIEIDERGFRLSRGFWKQSLLWGEVREMGFMRDAHGAGTGLFYLYFKKGVFLRGPYLSLNSLYDAQGKLVDGRAFIAEIELLSGKKIPYKQRV